MCCNALSKALWEKKFVTKNANFWLKKHYVSKADIENQKPEKSDKDDTSADKENHPQTDAETQTDEEISAQVC